MFGERGCHKPRGACDEVRQVVACCCSFALRTFFRQPSKATIPFLIFCVSNTLAQDNREHLLSCGRIRTLLAMMSFMHACLGKGVAACHSVCAMKCVESLHIAVRLRCGFVRQPSTTNTQCFFVPVSNTFAQDSRREVFPTSCSVRCRSNTLQNLINPLIRINP